MKLLIGIVTYNSRGTIDRCLDSLLNAVPDTINSSICIYDNNSTDGTVSHIKEKYPVVQIIESMENRGYAFGVNRIAECCDWDTYLILNPDLYLEKGSLRIAVDYFKQNKDVSLLGANILDEKKDPTHSHGDLLTPRMFVFDFSGYRQLFPRRHWSTYKKVTYQSEPFDAGYVTGAFMLIRKDAWEKIGPFDESFFLYFEDTDWAFRLKKDGQKIIVHPDVKAVHESGASFDENEEAKYYKLKCFFISAYRYIEKHYGFVRMKIAFAEVVRYANAKLSILKTVGKSGSDAVQRQELILGIHDDIKVEVLDEKSD